MTVPSMKSIEHKPCETENVRSSLSRCLYYYCPQKKFAKVIFLHLSVILFTGGGVWLSAYWDTPPGADSPRRPKLSRHPWEQTLPRADSPLGADSPREQTPLTVDTPSPQYTPPGSRHHWEQTPPTVHTPWEQTPPEQTRLSPILHALTYGKQTCGGHLPGMHTCCQHTI